MEDFYFIEYGKTHRHIGMVYFLKNSKGIIESYSMHSGTSARDLKIFIEQKRCFVFKKQELLGGKMIEVLKS